MRTRITAGAVLAVTALVATACGGGGAATHFALQTKNSQPAGITTGPDGHLWFTEFTADKIGRITPAGAITEFPLPAKGGPYGIAAGPDGNLWFALQKADSIGRMTPTGVVKVFPIPYQGPVRP